MQAPTFTLHLNPIFATSIALVGLFSTAELRAQLDFILDTYIIPDFYDTPNSEYAEFDRNLFLYTDWSDPFNTPVPANVNTPDPNGQFTTNFDAVLAQTGTNTAILTSSDGIYSFAAELGFTVFDDPSYDVGQVIFQVGSFARLPDIDSALLFYRETPGGPISEGIPHTNIGFLSDTGDAFTPGVTAWEWDLSGVTVAEYYITFNAEGTSMSYITAFLDTQAGYEAELSNAVFLGTNGSFESPGTVSHELVGGDVQLSYDDGEQVRIRATANPFWVFLRWSGDTDSTSDVQTVTINGNFNADAIYTPTNYDTWSKDRILPQNFGGDPADPPPTADPNNNGWNNILEYALGGLPFLDTDPEARPQTGITPDGKHMTLTYRKQPFATDLVYRVHVSTDFSTSNYNGDGLGGPYTSESLSTTYNLDGTQTVTVTDLTDLSTLPPGSTRKMFIEVIYTPPPPE